MSDEALSAAIEAVFPRTEVQNGIIHQLRNSSKYVSCKDIKALVADLKAVYAAVDESVALDDLDAFSERWVVFCQKPGKQGFESRQFPQKRLWHLWI